MTKTGHFVDCKFTYGIEALGVPREQIATALEYVAKILRKYPDGEVVAIYDADAKSWSYELIKKSERREFV